MKRVNHIQLIITHTLSEQIKSIQPRESKLRTKDNAQAHKSSSEFEITALLLFEKERQFQILSYFYELEHYPSS